MHTITLQIQLERHNNMDNDFKNIEWLEELAKRETPQEQKDLDQALDNYEI